MAYEWVPSVVTGTVAITVSYIGARFTFLTGREGREAATALAEAQREDERERRLRDERRGAYLGFLEAISDARQTLFDLIDARNDNDGMVRARKIRSEATAKMSHRRDELRLLGQQTEVRELARLVFIDMLEALKAVYNSETVELDHDLHAALVASMKADLGLERSSADVAALLYAEPLLIAAREGDSDEDLGDALNENSGPA